MSGFHIVPAVSLAQVADSHCAYIVALQSLAVNISDFSIYHIAPQNSGLYTVFWYVVLGDVEDVLA